MPSGWFDHRWSLKQICGPYKTNKWSYLNVDSNFGTYYDIYFVFYYMPKFEFQIFENWPAVIQPDLSGKSASQTVRTELFLN